MARTEAGLIADAEAEAYWSKRNRATDLRRKARASYATRPTCCYCKIRPVENKPNSVLCATDAREYRRLFSEEP